jgi:hypothetical protein
MVVSFDSFYVYVIETSTGDDGESRVTPFSARSCSAVRCRGECRVYCLGSEGNQHKFELGNTLQVTVRRDGSEVAFQSGSSDQGIDITDSIAVACSIAYVSSDTASTIRPARVDAAPKVATTKER